MVGNPAKCPKCDGIMEEGQPVPATVGWGKVPWQTPVHRRVTAMLGAKEVRGLSCKDCGYVELYTKP